MERLTLSNLSSLPTTPEPSPPPPSAPSVSLPYELWAHIIDLSAPRSSYDTWPTRSAALRSLSLVSPAFRSIAQGLLLRHPVLPRHASLRLLLRTLEEQGEGSGDDADEALWRRSLVRSVRMGSRRESWGDASGEVGVMLELCQRVEEVRLYQVGQIEVAQLAKGQALRRLFVVKTTLRHSPLLPAPLCLPHLQHLHLHLALANVDPLVGSAFFAPSALPNLSAFARFALGTSPSEARLLSRLSALSLSKSPPPALARACARLELWDLQSPVPAGAGDPAVELFAPGSVGVVRFSRPGVALGAAPGYLERFAGVREVHVREVGVEEGGGLEGLRRWGASKVGGGVEVVVEEEEESYMGAMFNSQFWRLVDRLERLRGQPCPASRLE